VCTVTPLSVPLVALTVMPADGSALLVPFAGVICTADVLAGRTTLPLCPPPLCPAPPEQAAASSALMKKTQNNGALRGHGLTVHTDSAISLVADAGSG